MPKCLPDTNPRLLSRMAVMANSSPERLVKLYLWSYKCYPTKVDPTVKRVFTSGNKWAEFKLPFEIAAERGFSDDGKLVSHSASVALFFVRG